MELVNTPQQQLNISRLTRWYGQLQDFTPRSQWFESPPALEQLLQSFQFPLFLKGDRQTARHSAASIVRNSQEYAEALRLFESDPLLRWQTFVCRDFVPLRSVGEGVASKIPPSFEFRSFCWKGVPVGFGPYWGAVSYSCSASEQKAALELAARAAARLDATFVCIDLAMTRTGEWIVIECNDAMEAGYASISPLSLWRRICDAL